MMGREILDPLGVESATTGETATSSTPGLGILAASTTLEPTKVVEGLQSATVLPCNDMISVQGYEIHSGRTIVEPGEKGSPLLRCQGARGTDGWIDGSLAGTYFHGLLESRRFRSWYFLDSEETEQCDSESTQVDPFDRLAEHLIAHGLDFDTLSGMMGLSRSTVAE